MTKLLFGTAGIPMAAKDFLCMDWAFFAALKAGQPKTI